MYKILLYKIGYTNDILKIILEREICIETAVIH